MKATTLLKKCPQDLKDGMSGFLTAAITVAQAFEANKAVKITVYDPQRHQYAERRLRPIGFRIEQIKDDKGKVTGRELHVCGAVTWYSFQLKDWDVAREQHKSLPTWAILSAEPLDTPAMYDDPVPAGFKRIFPVSVGSLRSQRPQVVPLRQAKEALASKEWAERPTYEVQE
jgi:hypothetical protein